jgi:hypothetical protein
VPVIVFLKNQPAVIQGSPARSSRRSAEIAMEQAPYLAQLQQWGARDVQRFRLVNAIAAQLPAGAVGKLAASQGVAAVIPDSPIQGPGQGAAASSARGTASGAVKPLPRACSARPQLEPEALSLTRTVSQGKNTTTARSLGYTGAGVKIAFLADGIDTRNVNLMRHGKPVITDYQDFSGDGRNTRTAGGEAFMDANGLAGQGAHVYNVAGFSARPSTTACNLRIEGVAPGASLVALKVFSRDNVSATSGFLRAIDYAVSNAHVNVLNESFGANPFPDVTSLDAVKEFNDMATAAGVTVVVAAGDAGPFNTIGSPASDQHVLSVGASTDFRFYGQTDYAAASQFAARGWEDNNISAMSSGGYTQDGRTVSLVAPGDQSFASCTASAGYSSCVNFRGKPSAVEVAGGTSLSAPLVSGAAALVIQAYRKAHGGATPPPATVAKILLSTATDLRAPATEQGSGLLNSLKAVVLASWRARRTPAGSTVSTLSTPPTVSLSANQLSDVARPGSAASWALTVTNTGKKAQTVHVTGRAFTSGKAIKTALVRLKDGKSAQFTSWAGVPSNYGAVKFSVPAGAATLNTSIAWPASASATGNLNARVRLLLIDPARRVAAYSAPQGVSGYGSAQALHPSPGTWMAVIFSDTAKAGGTTGTVRFGASVTSAVRFGSLSPATLPLAPGASRTVRVSATVPAGGGDSSGAVVLSAGLGGAVSVPVTLRGVLALGLGAGRTFSGLLTGGNGRAPGEGQVVSYAFDVPGNLPVLLRNITVNVTLANDPANQVSGYLVAPGGQTMGYGSSYLTTGFTTKGVPVEQPRRQLSLFTSNPIPGQWTLVIDFTSPVPGNELSAQFSGLIRLNAESFNRGGLPDSPSVTLQRNASYKYEITVKNTSAAPEDVFLDPRLTSLATYRLQPQDQVSGVGLPLSSTANPPAWIVPTMTHSVSATATSPVPVMFDFGPFPGDPDQASSAGHTASATLPLSRAVTPVTQGLWFAIPSEVGPFPASGAPRAPVTLSMTATTQAFDTAASSPPGDFWRFSVSPLAKSASYNLFPVNPGQTRTIALTVTPSAARGTVVRGMLYVDDFADSLQFLSGSQIVAIPYSYTVGLPLASFSAAA